MDPRELVAALEQHHDASFAWARACCGGERADAEDALQQAYLKILDGRARFAGRSAFRTWLFGVIRYCAIEQRRRVAVRRVLSGRLAIELVARALSARPDDALAGAGDTSAVRRALRALSRRQREVLELVAYHDLTIEQAGEVLGLSAGTARTHYERGKQRLAARLAAGGGA